MKVKDLIKVPSVETVIQLSSVLNTDDREKLQNLVESFVVTEDVYKNFFKLFKGIIENSGSGYFLKGNFGSGKSHFLSAVSLILQYHKMWDFIIQQKKELKDIKESLKDTKYLVIKTPLILYRAEQNLEQIILKSFEKELKSQNINISLTDSNKIVNNFFKITSQKIQDEFKIFLSENNIHDFESSSNEHKADIIKRFTTLNEIPLQFSYDRDDVFQKLFDIKKKYNYSGIIILIDELSEFLRSKPTSVALDEDIRFLQFIGEQSINNPIWIVGAMQEEIREISNISDKIFTKIKDRYKNRLELTTLHLEELIEKRLIIKKASAEKTLSDFYHNFIKTFSLINIKKERFIKIYPLINPTLTILGSITNIFSKQRGIVDFVHHQIKGDPKRNIKGIMNEKYDTFITPEKIFDHFENNIQEFIDTNPYYEIVYRYYLKNLPDYFPDKKEQILSLRIIKILILLKISPSISSQSVKSIVNMLMYEYSSTDSMLNYEYIYENIIKKFLFQMNYVIEDKREKFIDNIISINIEVNLNQIIDNKVQLKLKSFENKDDYIIESLLKKTELPFLNTGDFINKISHQHTFYQNTSREGLVTLIELKDITEKDIKSYNKKIHDQDMDFFIIIGKPTTDEINMDSYINTLLKNIEFDIKKNFLFWVPDKINQNKIAEMIKYYSYLLLLDEYKNDNSKQGKKINNIIKNYIENKELLIKDFFGNSYASGTFISSNPVFRKMEYDISHREFETILRNLIKVILDIKYPRHIEIKPEISNYNIIQFQNLIKYFFKTNEIRFEEANMYGILPVIEGILIPLYLAQKYNKIFYLKVTPNKSDFLIEYLSLLNKGAKSPIDIYHYFRNSTYGINKTIFLLITSALISSGLITGKRNNRPIDISNFDFYKIESIDEIYPGEIVDENIQKQLFNLTGIIDKNINKEIFTLDVQNKIWDSIVNLKKTDYMDFLEFESEIEKLNHYSVFKKNNIISRLKSDLKDSIEIINNIKVSYNPKNGTENFIQNIKDIQSFNNKIIFIRLFINFIKNHFQEYIFILNYLDKIFIPDSFPDSFTFNDALKKELSDIEFIQQGKNFDKIKQKFTQFQESYITLYFKEHNKYYNSINFNKLNEIKNSLSYEILKRLNRIKLISVDNDSNKIDNIINDYFSKGCNKINLVELRSSTTQCICGYKLGDIPFSININEIHQSIKNGITEYIKELTSEEYIEKLTVYIVGLRKIDKTNIADSLQELMNLKTSLKFDTLITKLKYLITYELIDDINKALEGETIVIERDINKLSDKIINKNLAKNKLIKIFYNWLTEDDAIKLNDNIYISVMDKKQIIKLIPEPLKDRLNKIFINIEEEKRIQLFIIVNWLYKHKLDINKNTGLLLGINIKNININSIIELYEEFNGKFNYENLISQKLIKELLKTLHIEKKDINQLIETFNNEIIFLNINAEIAGKIITEMISQKLSLDDIDKKIQNNHFNEITEAVSITDKLIKFKILLIERKNNNGLKDWVTQKYISHLSEYELLINKLSLYNVKYELILQTVFKQFKKECEKNISNEENYFKQNIQKNDNLNTLANWHKRKLKNNQKSVIFLFDGMRWDLWNYFKSILHKNNFKIIKEDYQFALPPTDTIHQRFAFFHGKYEFDENIQEDKFNNPLIFGRHSVWINCSEYNYKKSIIENKIDNNNIIILGFNFIDDKLHNQKFELNIFYKELEIIFQEKVIPLFSMFSEFSDDYRMFITADHGFKSQLNWQRRGEYRYSHGGDSPYEVIIPDIEISKQT